MASGNNVPSYRHHRSSGQAVVTLNGQDVYLGKFNSPASRLKYDQAIQEWLARGRQADLDDCPITVVEICNRFRIHAEQYYRRADGSLTSEVSNFKPVFAVLRGLYRTLPAVDFSPLKLKAVRERMAQQTRHGRKWARTYINSQVNRVRQIFKWAVAEELIPAAVLEGLKAVAPLKAGRCDAPESKQVKPALVEHVEAVLPHLPGPIAAMVRLQLLTGMRPGEVITMRGCDIDTSGALWIYRPAQHKTAHHGHAREIYLGPKAQELLKPFLTTNLTAPLFSPRATVQEVRERRARQRKTPLHRGNRAGTNRKTGKLKCEPAAQYTVDGYRRAITRACDKADAAAREEGALFRVIPRFHPHQLRHTAGTELRKTYGLEAAQVILGHKTLTVTQVYAEKNKQAARRVMAEVG